jgi:hypothetical protein
MSASCALASPSPICTSSSIDFATSRGRPMYARSVSPAMYSMAM